jgi:hypothetical protein
LLFSQSGSCIALPLQLCLVSSSPSKVEQFRFEYYPQSHQTSSAIHYGPVLRGWLITPLHSQPLCLSPPLFGDSPAIWKVGLSHHLVLSSCSLSYLSSLRAHLLVPPIFSEAGSVFHSTSTVSVWLQLPFYAFQFCLGGIQFAQGLLCLMSSGGG